MVIYQPSGRFFRWITACVLLLASCGGTTPSAPPPPPAPSPAGDPEAAYEHLFDDTFFPVEPESSGSGIHGVWEPDRFGLPSYRYTINQLEDPRAATYTSRGSSSDHWHQLGNDAITLTAHNGGYIQFWDWSRGGKCINRYRPESDSYSGGFRFVRTERDTPWNTLYQPGEFPLYERLFGTGYVRKETLRDGLRIVETTYAPFGRDALVISETEITNTASFPRDVTLYEYWDFNLYQLLLAPIMTAPLGDLFEKARWTFQESFRVKTGFDPGSNLLTVVPSLTPGVEAPAETDIAINDYYPAACFLAALNFRPDVHYTDQQYFFGPSGPGEPEAVVRNAPSRLLPGETEDPDRACLVFGKHLHLEPGERVSISYAFGYAPEGSIPALLEPYRQETASHLQTTVDAWIRNRADLVVPEPGWLRREILWHGYYLPAGSFVESYFNGAVINQGSAYGYIHGMNGAHRDFALFSMPLVYLRPDLARETIRYTLRSQDADTGKIPYAHQGYGFTSGYLVHEESTDLDLFFLMALAEYLGATRDFGFLDTRVPYYPLSEGREGPVREHVEKALDHLEFHVGTGPNGLIRAGSGDWNDVLIAFSPSPLKTMTQGESNLNTGMACFLFPRLADLLRPHMPEAAQRMERMAQDWTGRLRQEWTGRWMRRGGLGDGTYLGEDKLFLDAQPWPLLGRLWTGEQAGILLHEIHETLVKPSPAGALCLYPPYPAPLVPGSDTNGGTWAAVDSWLAWAWALYEPEKAWDFFLKTTLHAQAEAYPEIWYGVWSGPDSYNAYADRPGETFNWSVTPMTDFPVMNMNRHSGPLLVTVRMAGIDPAGERILVSPRLPCSRFSLRLPLLGIAYLPDRHRGTYRPVCRGTFPFRVRLPEALSSENHRLLVNGHETSAVCLDGHLDFQVEAGPGETVRWEILPKSGS